VRLKISFAAIPSHLMQEFCKDICYKSEVRETPEKPRWINANYDYSRIFHTVAEDLGKNIFEKLARGVAKQNRSDTAKAEVRRDRRHI
jgi:hypothetical protein